MRKLEEEYEETQFQKNYFHQINEYIAPSFVYDEKGNVTQIDMPLRLSEKDQKLLLSYLLKIEVNRKTMLMFYSKTTKKVKELAASIKEELAVAQR